MRTAIRTNSGNIKSNSMPTMNSSGSTKNSSLCKTYDWMAMYSVLEVQQMTT